MKIKNILSSILLTIFSGYVFATFTVESGKNLILDPNEVLTINDDIVINGTLTGAANAQIRVSNNWTNNGSFIHGDASVFFTGSGESVISGNNTFYSLISRVTESDTTEKTLTFTTGVIQTITHSIDIQGTNGPNQNSLRSSAPGTQAILDLSSLNASAMTFDALNVKDMSAMGVSSAINPANSTDSGNNTNWFSADTDGDGILDTKESLYGTDNRRSGYYGNPLELGDTDKDLLPDNLEKYIKNNYFSTNTTYTTANLNSATDSDGDGLPDALEVIKGYDPTNADIPTTNGATVTNTFTTAVENYLLNLPRAGSPSVTILTPITSYNDSDGDGLPDVFEVMQGFNPQDANHPVLDGAGDSDGDGVNNAIEYYLNSLDIDVTNSYLDSDKDGLPDAVEVTLGSDPLKLGVDYDNDKINDNVQNYLNSIGVTPTTIVSDYDSDGLPDILDIAIPLSGQQAKDKTKLAAEPNLDNYLTNYASVNYPGLGFVTAGVDTDGDGISNSTELATGFSPFITNKPYGVIKFTQSGQEFSSAKVNTDVAMSFEFSAAKYYSDTGITFAWDVSNISGLQLVGSGSLNDRIYTIKSYIPGSYVVSIAVTKDGTTYNYEKILKLTTNLEVDKDKDGIADSIDDNYSGLQSTKEASSTSLITANAGTTKLKAVAGKIAIQEGKESANISGSSSLPADNGFERKTGVFDFEVNNIPANTTVITVIIPLDAQVPANAVYRKLTDQNKWETYPSDRVETAVGTQGNCSNIAEASWRSTTTGDWCVRLTLHDGLKEAGGYSFDTDGVVNGAVKDPGVFAVPRLLGGSDGDLGDFRISIGGGCVMLPITDDAKVFDPTLYVLLLLLLIFGVRRYVKK